MEIKKVDSNDIRLIRINTVTEDTIIDSAHERYQFHFAHDLKQDIENGLLIIETYVGIHIDGQVTKFMYDFYFQITNFKAYCALNEDGLLSPSDELIGMLLQDAFGTIRGIMYSNYKNAGIENPVITPVFTLPELMETRRVNWEQ